MTARLLGVVAFLVLLAAPATVAHASGEYPPGGCVVTIDLAQPGQGEPFTVTATVEQALGPPERLVEVVINEITTVTFTFNGQTFVRPVVNGVATVTLTGPAPGSYTGTAECGPQVVDWDVSVPTTDVPPTGSDSTRSGIMIGTGMLGLGGLMVAVARRRRDEPAFA